MMALKRVDAPLRTYLASDSLKAEVLERETRGEREYRITSPRIVVVVYIND
jgi:hypothetical protein